MAAKHGFFGDKLKTFLGWLNSTESEEVVWFSRTVTITSAAAATAVPIIAASEVPTGKKVYLTDFRAKVNGSTQWATAAPIIEDTAGNDIIGLAAAALTANAYVGPHTTTNVTYDNRWHLNTGGDAGKGLQIKSADNGTGSDLVVTVTGYVK